MKGKKVPQPKQQVEILQQTDENRRCTPFSEVKRRAQRSAHSPENVVAAYLTVLSVNVTDT